MVNLLGSADIILASSAERSIHRCDASPSLQHPRRVRPQNCSGRRAACEGLNNRIFQFEVAGDIIARAMKRLKFVVEKHRDGYVAYPLGLKGAVVGQGQSYESALADAKSAAAFHIESFGKEAFDDQDDVMEAFVTEASLTKG